MKTVKKGKEVRRVREKAASKMVSDLLFYRPRFLELF